MSTILDTILEKKREEVHALRKDRGRIGVRTDTARPFIAALQPGDEVSVIAEIKKASPSKGLIAADFDPPAIAARYRDGGAAALSVLTDQTFFQGSSNDLRKARAEVFLPVLRKDFIIDPLQVEETAGMNADAMLLIAAALSDVQMEELYAAARDMGMEALVEIHDGDDLDRAMKLEPLLIGINNRNLRTFQTDIETSLELRRHIPPEVTVVAESGIFTGSDTALLKKAGVQAVLVGESLMRSSDPAALLTRLRLGKDTA